MPISICQMTPTRLGGTLLDLSSTVHCNCKPRTVACLPHAGSSLTTSPTLSEIGKKPLEVRDKSYNIEEEDSAFAIKGASTLMQCAEE